MNSAGQSIAQKVFVFPPAATSGYHLTLQLRASQSLYPQDSLEMTENCVKAHQSQNGSAGAAPVMEKVVDGGKFGIISWQLLMSPSADI